MLYIDTACLCGWVFFVFQAGRFFVLSELSSYLLAEACTKMSDKRREEDEETEEETSGSEESSTDSSSDDDSDESSDDESDDSDDSSGDDSDSDPSDSEDESDEEDYGPSLVDKFVDRLVSVKEYASQEGILQKVRKAVHWTLLPAMVLYGIKSPPKALQPSIWQLIPGR